MEFNALLELGRAFFFDFRKTVTGKFSIAMIIVIILFSVVVGLVFGAISGPSSNNSLNSNGYYYKIRPYYVKYLVFWKEYPGIS